MIIAVDGPSGSGKSSISKEIAKRLNIEHLDTGAMYRLLALHLKNKKIDFCKEAFLDFKIDQNNNRFYLNGVDVSREIRDNEISKLASEVSKIKEVREYLVDMQRKISDKKSIILDGRDIGTVVFPNADFKFYLTASAEKRAKRREKELNYTVAYDKILEEIRQRDLQDSTREHSPLKMAEDAIEIDSSNLTVDEVVSKILRIILGDDDEK